MGLRVYEFALPFFPLICEGFELNFIERTKERATLWGVYRAKGSGEILAGGTGKEGGEGQNGNA